MTDAPKRRQRAKRLEEVLREAIGGGHGADGVRSGVIGRGQPHAGRVPGPCLHNLPPRVLPAAPVHVVRPHYNTGMTNPVLKGGSVQILELVAELGRLQNEMVVLVGDDGCLYFAHRTSPEHPEGKLDLAGPGADSDPIKTEQIDSFVMGKGMFEQWLDLNDRWRD